MPRAKQEKTSNAHVLAQLPIPKKMDKASLFSPPLLCPFLTLFFLSWWMRTLRRLHFLLPSFFMGLWRPFSPGRVHTYYTKSYFSGFLAFFSLSPLPWGEGGGRGHTMAEDVLLSPSPPWQHPPSIHPGSDSGRLGYKVVPRTLDLLTPYLQLFHIPLNTWHFHSSSSPLLCS